MLGAMTASLFTNFAPSTADVNGLLLPLLLYTLPLLAVHLREAIANDVLVVPRLQPGGVSCHHPNHLFTRVSKAPPWTNAWVSERS